MLEGKGRPAVGPVNLQTKITKQLHLKLREESAKRGMDTSNLVRYILSDYILRMEKTNQ